MKPEVKAVHLGAGRGFVFVDLRDFKRAVRTRLGPGHPLAVVLERTADRVSTAELSARVGDYVALLEVA